MRYLFDTTVCVKLLRGNRRMISAVGAIPHEDIAVSVITKIELLFGALLSDDPDAGRRDVLDLLAPWTLLPIVPSEEVFVRERFRLQTTGQIIGDFDLFIGCTAIHHGLTVVTDNLKHFNRIDGIKLERWPK